VDHRARIHIGSKRCSSCRASTWAYWRSLIAIRRRRGRAPGTHLLARLDPQVAAANLTARPEPLYREGAVGSASAGRCRQRLLQRIVFVTGHCPPRRQLHHRRTSPRRPARDMLWANRRDVTAAPPATPGRPALWVYGRAGQGCGAAAHPSAAARTPARVAYWCPACQHEPVEPSTLQQPAAF